MQYLSNYRLYFLVDNNGYFGIFPGYFGNRRLVRYFGSYSGISVIPVNLVNRRRVIVVTGSIAAVTLNSEMDFYLRNGRNGDFPYEMELQNSILFII